MARSMEGEGMLRNALLTSTLVVIFAGSAGAALAGDLPYDQAPSYAPAPLFTWNGVYLGGQIGYGWSRNDISGYGPYYAFSGVNYDPNGVVGGAHVGFNSQINQFLFGLEGDVEGTGVSKTYGFGSTLYSTEIPVQGSIRGRFGFALDRALFYVTGGAAFASITNTYQSWLGYQSLTRSSAGWTIGGGLEYAVTGAWSVRAEYRYADFGSATDYSYAAWPGATTHHPTLHAVRVGFSYRFDGLFGR